MKNRFLRFLLSFCFISLFISILSFPDLSAAKELPMLVKLSEMGESLDGKRVTVFGWVRSAEVKSGRRGSLHLEIIIGENDDTVVVFSIRPAYNVVGNEVIVQGIYHKHGRFAGFEQDRFIVADTIIRNWPEENKDQKKKQEKENKR